MVLCSAQLFYHYLKRKFELLISFLSLLYIFYCYNGLHVEKASRKHNFSTRTQSSLGQNWEISHTRINTFTLTAPLLYDLLSGQLHLHNGVHFMCYLEHLHRVHCCLQEHFMSSLHTADIFGMVIHIRSHWLLFPLTHDISAGEGTGCNVSSYERPAWYTALRECWRRASWIFFITFI